MKHSISIALMVGVLGLGCVSKTVSQAKSALESNSWVNPYLGSAQWLHEQGCNYSLSLKNGNTLTDNKNTMYYCTKVGAPAVHTKLRMFEDGNITRQDPSGSEIGYAHTSDIDPCYINLTIASSTIYDFYGVTLNGAKEMTGFQEYKISNSTQSDWTCVLTTNADI